MEGLGSTAVLGALAILGSRHATSTKKHSDEVARVHYYALTAAKHVVYP